MLEHLKQFILVQQEHFPIEHWSSSSTQLILVHQLDTIVFKLYSMKLHLVLFDISIFNHRMVVLQPPSALKVSFSSNDVHSFYFFVIVASGSGAFMQYAANQANSVPVGSGSQTTPTLTLTFNTNTNTYTTSG